MSSPVLSREESRSTFVVIPAYNEGSVVRETAERVLTLGVHAVCVDDGSQDDTLERLRGLPVNLLRHVVNLGQGAALQTGIDYALRRAARYIVTFDADGQHDDSDIPRLIRKLIDGPFDVVLGSRFLGEAVDIPRSRLVLLKAALLLTRLKPGLDLTDVHNGLRAFRASVAPSLRMTQDRMAHASEFLEKMKDAGLSYAEIPCVVRYSAYSRGKGQKGLGAFDILFDLALKKFLR